MARKKSKKVPEAPRAVLTLRDFDALPDWRWPVPEGTRVYMRSRVTIGMPDEMRAVWDEAKRTKGISLSELGRQMTKRDLIGKTTPKGL